MLHTDDLGIVASPDCSSHPNEPSATAGMA